MFSKSLCVVAIVSLAAGVNSRGGDKAENGNEVLKKIQGAWKFVSQEMDGKTLPKEEVEKRRITFTGDKWTVRRDGKVVQAGTHKFDPTKKPPQVDAAVTEGEDKDSTMLGIYELKEDTLKVCFDVKGKERPKDFTSKDGRMTAVVEREKK